MNPLLLPRFDSTGENFWIDDIFFKCILGGDYNRAKTDREGVVLLKNWGLIEHQLNLLQDLEVSRMVEFGVWQGGSAVLWPLVTNLEQYVGFDIGLTDFPYSDVVRNHPRFNCVKLHGQVSQEDRVKLESILAQDFQKPLDLIIDDASHQYLLSKATFNICFPMLRPGGVYLLEDWGWAHLQDYQSEEHPWSSSPALTNLVFELTMLAACRSDIVPRITISDASMLIWRGSAKLDRNFSIDNFIVSRGRKICPI